MRKIVSCFNFFFLVLWSIIGLVKCYVFSILIFEWWERLCFASYFSCFGIMGLLFGWGRNYLSPSFFHLNFCLLSISSCTSAQILLLSSLAVYLFLQFFPLVERACFTSIFILFWFFCLFFCAAILTDSAYKVFLISIISLPISCFPFLKLEILVLKSSALIFFPGLCRSFFCIPFFPPLCFEMVSVITSFA